MDGFPTLPQAFALLLTEPDGRRVLGGQTFDSGLAGAVLADLTLRGSVSLSDKRVTVTSGERTGDPVLDGVIGSIAACSTPRPAKWWVAHLGKRPLRDEVFGSLVASGLLGAEQRRTLGLFTSTTYPERDGAPEALLRARLADVLAGRALPSPYSAALIGLLDATGALRRQFPGVDRHLVRTITAGEWASPAVKAVLDDIQTAAIATVVAVTVATAGTTGSS